MKNNTKTITFEIDGEKRSFTVNPFIPFVDRMHMIDSIKKMIIAGDVYVPEFFDVAVALNELLYFTDYSFPVVERNVSADNTVYVFEETWALMKKTKAIEQLQAAIDHDDICYAVTEKIGFERECLIANKQNAAYDNFLGLLNDLLDVLNDESKKLDIDKVASFISKVNHMDEKTVIETIIENEYPQEEAVEEADSEPDQGEGKEH